MNRRALLGSAGSSIVATATAGCLTGLIGDGDATLGAPTDTQRGTTQTTPDEGPPSFDPGSDDPARTVELGSRDAVTFPAASRPHDLYVWNDASIGRTFRVTVLDGPNALRGSARTIALPSDGYARIRFQYPASYRVGVDVVPDAASDTDSTTISEDSNDSPTARTEATDRVTTLSLSHRRWDCNDSHTYVAVDDDHAVHRGSVTTDRDCPEPTVASVSFEVTGRECDDEGWTQGTVTYDDDTVTGEGVVPGPDDCYELRVDPVTYDPDTDQVAVDVWLSERTDCTPSADCPTGIYRFEYAVTFDDDLPHRVLLRQRTEPYNEAVFVADGRRSDTFDDEGSEGLKEFECGESGFWG